MGKRFYEISKVLQIYYIWLSRIKFVILKLCQVRLLKHEKADKIIINQQVKISMEMGTKRIKWNPNT